MNTSLVFRAPQSPPGGSSTTVGRTPHAWLVWFSALVVMLSSPRTVRGGEAVAGESVSKTNLVRVALSRKILPPLNDADALSAIKVWVESAARRQDARVEMRPRIIDQNAEMARIAHNQDSDIFCLATEDFLELRDAFLPNAYYSAQAGGVISEEYVITVPAQASAQSVVDLQQHSLIACRTYQSSLAIHWLDDLLAQRRQVPSSAFFASIKSEIKPSRAILPVFFGQVDAAVTTRAAYEAMADLNPQIHRRLRLLEGSPALVSAITCFARTIDPQLVATVSQGLAKLEEHEAGRQLLLFFKAERVVRLSEPMLAATSEMLARRRQATQAANAGPATPPTAP